MPPAETIETLQQLIASLEAELDDLHRRLPAHSIPPAMLARLDELDEQLAAAHAYLQALQQAQTPGTG